MLGPLRNHGEEKNASALLGQDRRGLCTCTLALRPGSKKPCFNIRRRPISRELFIFFWAELLSPFTCPASGCAEVLFPHSPSSNQLLSFVLRCEYKWHRRLLPTLVKTSWVICALNYYLSKHFSHFVIIYLNVAYWIVWLFFWIIALFIFINLGIPMAQHRHSVSICKRSI